LAPPTAPPSPPPPGIPTSCSSYDDPLEMTRADLSNPTLIVAPGVGGASAGLWTLATGADPAALHARGPDDPPLPDRCCAVCKGEDHEGETTTLYTDATRTTAASCGGFALKYVDDDTTGWVCLYGATASTEAETSLGDPSWWYRR